MKMSMDMDEGDADDGNDCHSSISSVNTNKKSDDEIRWSSNESDMTAAPGFLNQNNNNNSQNESKLQLMASLNLQRIESTSMNESFPEACSVFNENARVNIPFSYPHCGISPKWDEKSLWNAMTKHPLFSKYMKLQAELYTLFETMKSDCKKAACEEAFALLVKDIKQPSNSKSVVSKPLAVKSYRTPVVGKRGRPLKKKRGRPLKSSLESLKVPLNGVLYSDCNTIRSGDSSNFGASETRKVKSRRKCENCNRIFVAAKWYEKHQAACKAGIPLEPSGKFQSYDLSTADEDQKLENISPSSMHMDLSPLPNMNILEMGPTKTELESPTRNSVRAPLIPISPPKHESTERFDVSPQKSNPLMDSSPVKLARLSCEGCSRRFSYPASLSKHKLLCLSRKEILDYPVVSNYAPTPTPIDDVGTKTSPGSSGGNLFRCAKCHYRFATRRKLLVHQTFCCPEKSDETQYYLKCVKCLRTFPNHKQLLQHKAQCCPDSETESKVCSKCFKVFVMRDKMEAHKITCVMKSTSVLE